VGAGRLLRFGSSLAVAPKRPDRSGVGHSIGVSTSAYKTDRRAVSPLLHSLDNRADNAHHLDQMTAQTHALGPKVSGTARGGT
jgi:hypothetical protein